MARPLHLHIGAGKTGTSALQRGLFESVPALAAQGVGMPWTERPQHVQALLRPLGWVTAQGFVKQPRPARLDAAGEQVTRTGGDRLLVTCEDLCELEGDRLDLLVRVLESAGTQVRVVVTVRSIVSVVPSEWQQFLKHRLDLDYPTFLDRVRDHEGRWARHFWLRQDVEAICRRWADRVGTDRLDVVVTPDRRTDPEGLYRAFGRTVGFDPATVQWPDKDVNASWGMVEAEVYRRVNVALGTRLQRYERDYQPAVRWPFVRGCLPRGRDPRIPLPPEHAPWVTAVAQRHATYLRGSGIRVHGDIDALVPRPEAFSPLPPLDEAAVCAAAIETLVNLAVEHARREA